MKFDSLFDRIRVKPGESRKPRSSAPACEWPGCENVASHRAPKGRGHEREYWHYCLDHVRAYNQSYNYFAGMPDDAVAQYQKDALTGHRPTWRMGLNANGTQGGADHGMAGAADPFSVFSDIGGARRWQPHAEPPPKETRLVHNAERKALQVMGLDDTATNQDVKLRFKKLVKQHHPDANGGDRSSEDRLREIIQAYNYLKSKRFT